MSFWKTSAGTEATGEVEEMSFDPLPKGWYTSMLEEVSVDEYENQKKIKIKARIVGEGFGKNRVLFLNLKAFEGDKIKDTARDRAIQVLVKMYQICKAKLPNGEPDDRSLSQLVDKPMDLLLDIWELEDKSKSGNWLVNCAAKGEKAGGTTTGKPVAKSKPAPQDDDDSSIPF
ncbi:MAG: hypothetical protein EPO08_21170 [Rhodospirillaceae bacterium]|nr:MAG: hypothetical protein EPO08_21170 [Rhodospirillaceae bacterium]